MNKTKNNKYQSISTSMNIRKYLLISAISLVTFFGLVGGVEAADRQVGTGQTYLTIQSAVNASQSGDTIYVHTGTYAGFDLNGKTNITVTRYETDSVIVSTPVNVSGIGSVLVRMGPSCTVSYLTFSPTGSCYNIIRLAGGTKSVFTHNTVTSSATYCGSSSCDALYNGADGPEVSYNTFQGYVGGYYRLGYGNGFNIHHNTFDLTAMDRDVPIYTDYNYLDGTTPNKFEYNYVKLNSIGQFHLRAIEDMYFRNNIITFPANYSGTFGWLVLRGESCSGNTNAVRRSYFTNNTFYSPVTLTEFIETWQDNDDNYITNNLFIGNATYGVRAGGAGNACDPDTGRENKVYYNKTTDASITWIWSGGDYDAWAEANNTIAQSVVWNDASSDMPNPYFNLTASLDGASYSWNPVDDYNGDIRGAIPDVGAFEYFLQSDTTPPSISNGSPSGALPSGTTQTTMSVTTNENATCRWSSTSGVPYSSMTNTFLTTGGTSHSTTITGLSNGQIYNRYIRCQNTGGYANTSDYLITFSIASPDSTPPSVITTLSTSNPTSNSITLSWTSPGDDGNTGTATSYDIRYSTSNITDTNWSSVTQAGGEPLPLTAGTPQSMTVTGLLSNTTYYFAIKTSDEASNVSDLSNVPSATTSELPSGLIEAETGTLGSPMQIVSDANASGGQYIQTPTSNSGTSTYTFNIAETGIYKIVARVYTASLIEDSLFFKIDSQTEDIWDLNPLETPEEYNVWREDELTKRGTGTVNNPQYDPYTLELTQGSHILTFRGREAYAKLDYFQFVQVSDTTPPAAPTGLTIN